MENKHTSLVGAARRDLGRLRACRPSSCATASASCCSRRRWVGGCSRAASCPSDDGTVQGSAPVRFTRMLASLGPTFIKLGQILSMRQDLFPREWIEALETLQDEAPVVPFEQIRATSRRRSVCR